MDPGAPRRLRAADDGGLQLPMPALSDRPDGGIAWSALVGRMEEVAATAVTLGPVDDNADGMLGPAENMRLLTRSKAFAS
jgi:hypothetical protein